MLDIGFMVYILSDGCAHTLELEGEDGEAWPPSETNIAAFVERCEGLFEIAAILIRRLRDPETTT